MREYESLQCHEKPEKEAKPEILSYSKVRDFTSEIVHMQTEICSKIDSIKNFVKYDLDNKNPTEMDKEYLKGILDRLEEIQPQDKMEKKGKIESKEKDGKTNKETETAKKTTTIQISDDIKDFYKKRGPKPKEKQIEDIQDITPDALRKKMRIFNANEKFWGTVAQLTWAEIRRLANKFSKKELEKLLTLFGAAYEAWSCKSCGKVENEEMKQCSGKRFDQMFMLIIFLLKHSSYCCRL